MKKIYILLLITFFVSPVWAQQKSGLSYTVIGDDPKPSEITTLQIKTTKPDAQNTEEQNDPDMEKSLERVWKKYHALAAGTEAPSEASAEAPEDESAAPTPEAETTAPPPTSINGILQNHQHNKKRAASMRTLTVDHGGEN